ncbi:MAG: hypothetical protein ACJ790_01070 [Myxococcaceae bacterium]
MILIMNVLGWFTLILGFSGLFSATVPKWLALITLAAGALTMFASFSKSRARPYEPLTVAALLLAVGIVAVLFHTNAYFPILAFAFSAAHLGAAAEGSYLSTRDVHNPEFVPRAFFWRRIHLW